MSQALARYGVRTVFAVGGASHTHLLDALDRDGVRVISSRHESGCVGAADGYARATGRIGVALIIAEQGLPNAINGIAVAYHAASPVLVLVARLPNSWTEAEAEHDNARHSLVDSITKWARTVPTPDRLAEFVDAGCKRALSGRCGPVLLQVPQEYFGASVAGPGAAAQPAPSIARPAADPARIAQAARLLRDAQRPLLITGAGATWGRAQEPLAALVEQADLPIAGNGLGRGVVPEDWERSFSWPLMQIAAREADVVCLIGARLKQRLGFGLPPRFAPGAKFIQVDIEPTELSRNRRIDVPIVADAGIACRQLLEAMQAAGAARGLRANWVRDALRDRLRRLDDIVATAGTGAVHPLVLGRELARRLPENAIIVGDGADVQNWMYGALRVRRAPGFLEHYPMGAMGSGTPLAVGAAAAARELAVVHGEPLRPVLLVTGDGSFGFYPAELHAAAQAGLKIICVVGNDGAWGTELHGQVQAIGRTINTELSAARYDLVGRGFGCHGEYVQHAAELQPALDRAFAQNGPSVIDVALDRNAGAQIKSDPLARMIMFDDLASNLQTQHEFAS
ncbi:MAG: thiamine pyrophosphate-binding protein [Sinobacteraceae bacterium]|nr:thiamine pyrophosphate-binding protein [Nevskiaceae bacterium]MCP5339199.1 thiamine pyrophosphate-binding protein [Nevskiaceae bacterium]MCP5359460.1 thiamine pyrophosphate-binding protein [Nevskiaceae bacterium]MCP5466802.1 thiamine pyrophosphate-binding protein [Nevskiaceae bacterium]MCP5470891.1 thiamine pyrophosphate-binding protein [Nevskiaceae bacterium]